MTVYMGKQAFEELQVRETGENHTVTFITALS
jgi:hypothetical protein